jgi:glycosyltransferase involved in cell wall biosynthesis
MVPRFEPGAVGTTVLEGRAALRSAGYESEIYADEIDERFADRGGRLVTGYTPSAADVVVYHLAIGATLADRVATLPGRLVVVHHNLTPAELLEPWDPGLGPAVTWGRRQLDALSAHAVLGIGDSDYNTAELVAAGYRNAVTVPVMFDRAALAAPDAATLARLHSGAGGHDWLFASRVAPNKAHHDLVAAFAMYRQAHAADARLFLPGGCSSPHYLAALRGYVEALDLADAVELPGAVSDAELGAYFAAADVFVCLSDHEGFAVPLLEAWQHALPVVAHSAAAVPGTAGDAAILLDDKEPATVAAAVARVLSDTTLRADLVARGRRRLDTEFEPTAVRARFVAAIGSVA